MLNKLMLEDGESVQIGIDCVNLVIITRDGDNLLLDTQFEIAQSKRAKITNKNFELLIGK